MSTADPGQEPAASVLSGRGQRWVASRSRCAVLVLGVASAFRFVLGVTWETLQPRASPPGAACRPGVLRGSGSASCVVRCRVAGPFAVLRRSSPELRFPSLWCGGGRLRKRRLAFRGRMRVRRCWPALVLCCRREGWGHWASWHAGTGIRWRLLCWRIQPPLSWAGQAPADRGRGCSGLPAQVCIRHAAPTRPLPVGSHLAVCRG